MHAPHWVLYTSFIFILTYCNTWWYLVCSNSRYLLWADEHINKLIAVYGIAAELVWFFLLFSEKPDQHQNRIVRSFWGKLLPYIHSCWHRNREHCSNITTSMNSEVMFIFPALGHGKLSEARGVLVIIFCQVFHLIIILLETISQKGLHCQHHCSFFFLLHLSGRNAIALNGLSFFFIRSLNWIQSLFPLSLSVCLSYLLAGNSYFLGMGSIFHDYWQMFL